MGVRSTGLGTGIPIGLFAAWVLGALGDACNAVYMPDAADAAVTPTCEPRLCPDDACGTLSDGCGRALDCGTCGGGQCVDNRCACIPRTCRSAGATCGQLTDGCTGNVLFCGTCEASGPDPSDAGTDASRPDGGDAGPAALFCSADNRCVPVPCTPKTKDDICKVVDKTKKPCGSTSDGCGGMVDCGTVNCTGTGQTCGGGGSEGICGCKPKSTSSCLGRCGTQPNGCGGSIYCGSCR